MPRLGMRSAVNLPTDLERACETGAQGEVVDVDLGLAGGTYYANVASVGLGAECVERLTLTRPPGAFLFDTMTPLPNPTSQGSFGFLQHGCDLVRPVWYLATRDTLGLLEKYASVLEGKPVMPPSRDVGEILLGELLRGRVHLLSRYRE